jgi:hypothetical protein
VLVVVNLHAVSRQLFDLFILAGASLEIVNVLNWNAWYIAMWITNITAQPPIGLKSNIVLEAHASLPSGTLELVCTQQMGASVPGLMLSRTAGKAHSMATWKW